jgi:hypothetical protein
MAKLKGCRGKSLRQIGQSLPKTVSFYNGALCQNSLWHPESGCDFMIGDSIISVDGESNVIIKVKHFKVTRVLRGLLRRKDVNNKVITDKDLKKYKTILETTNAHFDGFEPGNDILFVRVPRVTKVIAKLFLSSKRNVHWVTIREIR